MADVDVQAVVDAGLEQRERKTKVREAEENGHDAPAFGAVSDFEAEAEAEPAMGDIIDQVEEPEEGPSNKLYFVRIPRPPVNDEGVKKLSASFQDQLAKLKAMNTKLGPKRDELRELRKQMTLARSLKDESQPEYEEKLNRLKDLRSARQGYLNKIQAIKEGLRGLECKSEEELDAKIKELEDKISHGSIQLREEKQIVQQISKLQSQRTAVRDYQNQKDNFTQYQAEADKIKTVIAELDGDFGILKDERGGAKAIMDQIKDKMKACEAELKDLEEEQAEAAKAKNDTAEALDKARAEMNESMVDYRDNRSFSLRVRDLVIAGQVEEARSLCMQQVDDLVGKLSSDVGFRKEYHKLMAAQRKSAVSVLLPDSTTTVKEAAKPAANGAGPKNGKAAPKAAPPKPQGAEKAKALIEELMASAKDEVARSRSGARRMEDPASGDADDEVDDLPAAPAPAPEPVVVAKRSAPAPSARPQDVLKSVELPKIDDAEPFVPPVIKDSSPVELDKGQLREEQARKAQEAELRKKKLVEQKEKKRKEADVKRKQDEELRKQEAVLAAQRAKEAKLKADEEAAIRAAAAAEAARIAAESGEGSGTIAQLPPKQKVIAKSQVTVAAKRPAVNESLLTKMQKLFKENMGAIVLFIVVVFLAVLLALMT